jgi:hypothetical protein
MVKRVKPVMEPTAVDSKMVATIGSTRQAQRKMPRAMSYRCTWRSAVARARDGLDMVDMGRVDHDARRRTDDGRIDTPPRVAGPVGSVRLGRCCVVASSRPCLV